MYARVDPGDTGSVGRSDQPSAAFTADPPVPVAAAAAAARWRRRPDDRLKRAVRRVLIALSFKSNKTRSTERGSKQQLQQQHQQQSLQLSSWQLIPGTGQPPANYWDPVRRLSSYLTVMKVWRRGVVLGDVCKHYIGPVGRLTLWAGTTSALSATRRGPDPNRPTRRDPDLNRPTWRVTDPIRPTRRGPDPIRPTRRVLTITDPRGGVLTLTDPRDGHFFLKTGPTRPM